jgi:hypothetical protein
MFLYLYDEREEQVLNAHSISVNIEKARQRVAKFNARRPNNPRKFVVANGYKVVFDMGYDAAKVEFC